MRISSQCKVTGNYKKKQAVINDTWKIPCQDFDRLNLGDKAEINLVMDFAHLIKVKN